MRALSLTILAGIVLFWAGCELLGQTDVVTLTTSAAPSHVASVEPDGREYEEGTNVTVEASVGRDHRLNFQFIRWDGDISSTENPYTFTIRENTHARAVFAWVEYSLTVLTEGEGEIVREEVAGAAPGYDGGEAVHDPDKDYKVGTEVLLEAAADDGWRFCFWRGEDFQYCRATNPTIDGGHVRIWDDRTVTAVFKRFGDPCGPCVSPVE